MHSLRISIFPEGAHLLKLIVLFYVLLLLKIMTMTMPLSPQCSSPPDTDYDSKQAITMIEGTAILSVWETGPLPSQRLGDWTIA
jgi:hypothetical protein